MRDIFTGYRILGWQFFQHLKYVSSFCLLLFLKRNPLSFQLFSPITKLSLLLLSKFFFNSSFQKFDYDVCCCGLLWVYLLCILLRLLNLQVYVLWKFDIFSHYFFVGFVLVFFSSPTLFLFSSQDCEHVNARSFVIVT